MMIGNDIILRATKYGRSLEVQEGEGPEEAPRRVQVPSSVNASSCPPGACVRACVRGWVGACVRVCVRGGFDCGEGVGWVFAMYAV